MAAGRRAGAIVTLAAGIVVFRPKLDLLLALAERLAAEADGLFIFANGVEDAALLDRLRECGAQVIACDYNLGVAEAFNQLALHAICAGHDRLAIFDEDSGLPPGGLRALSESMDRLEAAGRAPAVLGPRIVAPADAPDYRSPRYFRARGEALGALKPVRYVISSGSLLSLNAFRRVGPFRSDFFIDAVDTEWCFRTWRAGFSVWADDAVHMEHRIGAGVTRRTIFGAGFPRQPLMRLYAYMRNQTYCLRLRHIPLGWRLLVAAHLVRLYGAHWLDAPDRAAFARMANAAVRDGLSGRLGPPPGAHRAANLALDQGRAKSVAADAQATDTAPESRKAGARRLI